MLEKTDRPEIMDELVALYFSDFFIVNRRTINTLCLFYDRVFLHDYFGIFAAVEKDSIPSSDSTNPSLLKFNWDIARGLTPEHLLYFISAEKNEFDALILKGVAQGLGFHTGNFSPSFVIQFARSYGRFLRQNYNLFTENVLCLCQTSNNPFHPIHNLEGGVKLKLDASEKENLESLNQARLNNVKACIFEESYHRLPLISDEESSIRRWDRDVELLTMALLEAAIPSMVPTIQDVPADEILQARERLKDYLPPFRLALKNAAWDIAAAARSATRKEMLELGNLYFHTKIEPTIKQIEMKLAAEDKRLKRKLLERGIDTTVLLAKAVDPTERFSKWDLFGSGLKSLLDIDNSLQIRKETQSSYEYLVRLPRLLRS